MRRTLGLLLLLALAAPAGAAEERPRCVKRLAFAHYSVRVAKLPDGERLACQGRSRKSFAIGDARGFDAAGRYLTYVDPGEHGGEALRRLDVRTGERHLLDRSGPAMELRFIASNARGDVAWSTAAEDDSRLRVWDDARGQVLTVVAGPGLDPGNFALSADLTPYWTFSDGTPGRADLDQGNPAPFDYAVPAYRRTTRPRCKQNLIFLRGVVRVVRSSPTEMLACGPRGATYELGAARAFVAAGPWLVYANSADGDHDLVALDVRTGEERHLKRPGGFSATLDGLHPDGTVAWTDLDFTAAAVHRDIRIWRAGAGAPVVVEESVAPRESPTHEGLELGTVALAGDGTLYWRDEDQVVRRMPPPAPG